MNDPLIHALLGAVVGAALTLLLQYQIEKYKLRVSYALQAIENIERVYNSVLWLATWELTSEEKKEAILTIVNGATSYSDEFKVSLIFNNDEIISSYRELCGGFRKILISPTETYVEVLEKDVHPHYLKLTVLLRQVKLFP